MLTDLLALCWGKETRGDNKVVIVLASRKGVMQ